MLCKYSLDWMLKIGHAIPWKLESIIKLVVKKSEY